MIIIIIMNIILQCFNTLGVGFLQGHLTCKIVG